MLPKKIKTKTGEKITIREAKKTDALSLIKYLNTVAGETDFLTFGAGDFKNTIKEEEQIIDEHKKTKNKIFIVAELNKEIIGILNLGANNKPRTKHIGRFGVSVLKKHWGKEIGKNLIATMLEWSKKSGVIRKINLNVQTNNKSAIALYEKFGFEIEGILRRDSFVNGKFFDAYMMGKIIK